jgi:hypothetical protein
MAGFLRYYNTLKNKEMPTETLTKPKVRRRKKAERKVKPASLVTRKKTLKSGYNEVKKYKGSKYTGMAIGRSHKWYYDKGEWRETKITPDLWEIHYEVTKRRAGKAPEGSGVPVGTEYHWYILSHQHVAKLNANDYSTEMTGIKYKLAHKRADKEKWSTSITTQRKRLIKLLQDMIETLQKEPIPIDIEYKDKQYKGEGIPVPQTCKDKVCYELEITLNNKQLGIIHCTPHGWRMKNIKDQKFVDAIGEEIALWYE